VGLAILEVVLGAVISIIITILIESLRKPRLQIRIADYTDIRSLPIDIILSEKGGQAETLSPDQEVFAPLRAGFST